MVSRDALTGFSILIARLPQSQQTIWNSRSLFIEKLPELKLQPSRPASSSMEFSSASKDDNRLQKVLQKISFSLEVHSHTIRCACSLSPIHWRAANSCNKERHTTFSSGFGRADQRP